MTLRKLFKENFFVRKSASSYAQFIWSSFFSHLLLMFSIISYSTEEVQEPTESTARYKYFKLIQEMHILLLIFKNSAKGNC